MNRTTRCVFVMACAVIASAVSCSTDGRPQAAGPAQKTGATAEPSSPATNPGEQVRYLALGDSVTQGVGAVDEQTGSFPALVAERWRADGCDVELQNAGISGYTAGQILAEQVPQIKSFAPTLITFQTGGNDIVNGISIDEYRNNVKSVLDAAAGSGARVIVLAQNEWFRSPTGVSYVGDGGAAQRATFDDVMIEEASAHGAEFVDMRPLYAEQAHGGSGSRTVSTRPPRRTKHGLRSSARRFPPPASPSLLAVKGRRRTGASRRARP